MKTNNKSVNDSAKAEATSTATSVAAGTGIQVVHGLVPKEEFFGMLVKASDKKKFTFNPSLKKEGKVNVIFTSFRQVNGKAVAASAVTGGFHLSIEEASALNEVALDCLKDKEELGLNPNTIVIAFKAVSGRFIADQEGKAGIKWFTGVEEIQLLPTMEGPDLDGVGEEGQEQAHEGYLENQAAARLLKQLKQKEQGQEPQRRETAKERLARLKGSISSQLIDV